MDFSKIPSAETVNKTIEVLKQNGITAEVVATGEEAKEKVSSLIPKGAEVMTMTSITLEQTGIAEEINNSGNYKSVRKKLETMDRKTQSLEMQRLGAAPEWTIGSVHAVTEDGKVLVASNTGSQLPAYSYGSARVLWVVGTQKIVKDVEEGMKRISEYIVPKESERARKAYNLPDFNTNISKLLIVNREVNHGRIHIVFVNQELGF